MSVKTTSLSNPDLELLAPVFTTFASINFYDYPNSDEAFGMLPEAYPISK